MKRNYHHGDLRNSLIEAGIELVHEEGIQALSIRKAAAKCGVSHAAPRNHFENKESLLYAMQEHITNKFTQELQTAAACNIDNPDILHELGKSYFKFFINNPYYYNLVFNQMGDNINLQDVKAVNYPPFDVLKSCAAAVMKSKEISQHKWMQNITAMWSMVHGITSLAVTESTKYVEDWYGLLEKVMRENFKFTTDSGGI